MCTAIKRDGLEVGAVVASGLEAGQRKLRGNIFRSQLAAARAGSAAFKQIKREKAHMGADLFRIN